MQKRKTGYPGGKIKISTAFPTNAIDAVASLKQWFDDYADQYKSGGTDSKITVVVSYVEDSPHRAFDSPNMDTLNRILKSNSIPYDYRIGGHHTVCVRFNGDEPNVDIYRENSEFGTDDPALEKCSIYTLTDDQLKIK